ncbi:MAG: hypothetical protein HYY78_13850 [Betaproteobacteria bacterium]|nr:hypothetical protein [Betaproteobacteria bacterium]
MAIRLTYILIAAAVLGGPVHAAESANQDSQRAGAEQSDSAPAAKQAAEPPSTAQRPAQPPAGKPKGKDPATVHFEPPPVPEFMLRKSAKPLTLEEMQRQADEAAERARRERAAREAKAPKAGTDAGSVGGAPQ